MPTFIVAGFTHRWPSTPSATADRLLPVATVDRGPSRLPRTPTTVGPPRPVRHCRPLAVSSAAERPTISAASYLLPNNGVLGECLAISALDCLVADSGMNQAPRPGARRDTRRQPFAGLRPGLRQRRLHCYQAEALDDAAAVAGTQRRHRRTASAPTDGRPLSATLNFCRHYRAYGSAADKRLNGAALGRWGHGQCFCFERSSSSLS